MKIKRILIYLLKIILFAIVYHLTARFGLSLAYVQANTSPVWPPTGISIAVLVIFGINLWPGVSLGVLLGSILTGAPINLALGMSIGNTLEAVVIVFFLKKIVKFHPELDRVQDVLNLLLASVLGTVISATIGTITLTLINNLDWSAIQIIWITWWIGDLLGALVITPFLLVWTNPPPFSTNWKAYLEGLIQLILFGFLSWYVFSNQSPSLVLHEALLYVIFPVTIWATFRFGQRGASTAILLVSSIAIWGTSQGFGPFAMESTNDSLVLLQTFMGVVSLTMLILASTTIERHRANGILSQRVNDLVMLNNASKVFLDNIDIDRLLKSICKVASEQLGFDAAWIEVINGSSSPPVSYGITMEAASRIKSLREGEINNKQNNEIIIRRTAEIEDYQEKYSAYGIFPLNLSGRVIGQLLVITTDETDLSSDRLPIIESFANLAAVVIQNAWLFQEIEANNRQLHALSQRLMKAQEDERLHLSRELHDESGQLLSALSVQLGLLNRETGDEFAVKQRILELKRIAEEIQNNLHKIAVDLRPASLDHLGLVTALNQYIREFNRQNEIDVAFEVVGYKDRRLPGEVETAIFRIVQESLTNVVLHASATRADVLMNILEDEIITIIEDDGVGFTPSSQNIETHLGLFGMHERMEMLGGKLTIESSPGQGTAVNIEVPYDS